MYPHVILHNTFIFLYCLHMYSGSHASHGFFFFAFIGP